MLWQFFLLVLERLRRWSCHVVAASSIAVGDWLYGFCWRWMMELSAWSKGSCCR